MPAPRNANSKREQKIYGAPKLRLLLSKFCPILHHFFFVQYRSHLHILPHATVALNLLSQLSAPSQTLSPSSPQLDITSSHPAQLTGRRKRKEQRREEREPKRSKQIAYVPLERPADFVKEATYQAADTSHRNMVLSTEHSRTEQPKSPRDTVPSRTK